jgi:hypothetical protein
VRTRRPCPRPSGLLRYRQRQRPAGQLPMMLVHSSETRRHDAEGANGGANGPDARTSVAARPRAPQLPTRRRQPRLPNLSATDVREGDNEREHSVHTGLRQRPRCSTRGHPLTRRPPAAPPRHLWTAVPGVRRRPAVERFRQSAAAPSSQRLLDPSEPIFSANRTTALPGRGASAGGRARPALVARVAAADLGEELDERQTPISGRNGN